MSACAISSWGQARWAGRVHVLWGMSLGVRESTRLFLDFLDVREGFPRRGRTRCQASPERDVLTGLPRGTLHKTVFCLCSLQRYFGRGARGQPGLRTPQGATGGFSTTPAWEPTQPLDQAGTGEARTSASYTRSPGSTTRQARTRKTAPAEQPRARRNPGAHSRDGEPRHRSQRPAPPAAAPPHNPAGPAHRRKGLPAKPGAGG